MRRPKSYSTRTGKKSPGRRPSTRRQGQGPKRHQWSRAEIDRLRRLYPRFSNLEIARRLDRSLSSIISQAFKLGLKKSPDRLVRMGRENIAHRWGKKRKSRRKKR